MLIDHCEGGDLVHSNLKSKWFFWIENSAYFMKQILAGIAYMHSLNHCA